MDILYAPWREKYTEKITSNMDLNECVFCKINEENLDEKNFVLSRSEHSIILLNLYPYNAGHILVIPKKHTSNIEDLSDCERNDLFLQTSKSASKLKVILGAQGLNIGLNLGKAAGAGIPEHLHVHCLPRFAGDTNFLPILCNTKQVSFDLVAIYNKLKAHFK